MREKILKFLLKNPPKGDLWEWQIENKFNISCILVFCGRIRLIQNILTCLWEQKFNKRLFEILLIEDKGGTNEGKFLKEIFKDLNISYFAPSTNWGKMGYMRNYGLSKAKGEIALFLDDDTIILDKYFLAKLTKLFDTDESLMAVIPKGNPSFCLTNSKYSYHDPYFFTNRCMAYRKKCLIELKGFENNFVGQEDVEFAIRFLAKGYKYIKTNIIQYYHPPFIVKDLRKSQAVGYSFARLKYPFYLKFLLAINGTRWLYRIIYPTLKNKNMAKFAFGFMLGFLKGLYKKEEVAYV
ncbi:MAG TPA: glycosyltransferase family 2 protein [Candidatus Desulfofervidus auxilii]|uniref:Glycosyltransferase family 2 protein n=1 Tax=Desulfofervidus auxilii TaxID=1621989 RepID=A0A7C0U2Q2_DESA2|nr:glycosyltransferase family 2 protein [Candidatus Desulfofervidus auxilii]